MEKVLTSLAKLLTDIGNIVYRYFQGRRNLVICKHGLFDQVPDSLLGLFQVSLFYALVSAFLHKKIQGIHDIFFRLSR